MTKRDKLNVVLLALTGFGNPVLEALLKDARVKLAAVFTVKYDQPFPYYQECQLADVCDQQRIVWYGGVRLSAEEGLSLLKKHAPDLIIIATFKQILREAVLSVPPLGVVNFHPSLLPRYRGPCPTNAALYNDEETTGVTVHYVTERVDEGNLLLQKSVRISEDECDGQLRRKLATLAGEMVPELLGMFADFRRPSGKAQDCSLATSAPKPRVEDAYLDPTTQIRTIRKKMRAYNPLPGTSFHVGNKRVPVNRYELFWDDQREGLFESETAFEIVRPPQGIRLYKTIYP